MYVCMYVCMYACMYVDGPCDVYIAVTDRQLLYIE
jgi:hypothetical protein